MLLAVAVSGGADPAARSARPAPGPAGPFGLITEYGLPPPGGGPQGIVAGPDGNLWFVENRSNKIGRRHPAGVFTEFACARPTAIPEASRRGRTATSGSPRRRQQDRADHPGGRHHRVPDPHGTAARRDHGRARRQPLVHRVRRATEIGRITPGGAHHRVPDRRHAEQPARRDHGRPGRQPLVHRDSTATRSGGSRPAGVVTEFTIPTAGSQPLGITAGPGRQPLVHRARRQPDRADHARRASITEFPVPTAEQPADGHHGRARTATSGSPRTTATGSAGSRRRASSPSSPCPPRRARPHGHHGRPGRQPLVHRVTGNQIGRITPAGVVTEFAPPRPAQPTSIAAGPDGNLWFTELRRQQIGRITPAGTITEFAGPDAPTAARRHHGRARTATSGSPRTAANRIGRITPAGRRHRVRPVPDRPAASRGGIAAGPDGNLWFTETRRQPDRADHPGRGRSPSSATAPPPSSSPAGIAAGPGRQPLVHRAGGQQDRPDQPGRASSPSSICRHAPAAARAASRPGRTATSGSPSSRRPDRADHARRRDHRVRAVPTARQRPGASRPGRTATSGSPRRTATRSAISPAGAIVEYPYRRRAARP